MLLVRMGWLTPALRLSLVVAVITGLAKLLGYSQADIQALVNKVRSNSDLLDKIAKCRRPRNSSGGVPRDGDLIQNIFGQIERLEEALRCISI